jgi:hypothetical protein
MRSEAEQQSDRVGIVSRGIVEGLRKAVRESRERHEKIGEPTRRARVAVGRRSEDGREEGSVE